MPDLTITVFLSPNETYKGKRDPAWPKPAGVTLRLTRATRKGKKGKPVDLDPTDGDGVTSHEGIPAGKYRVKVLDPAFKGWAPSRRISVRDDAPEQAVVLTPPKGKWLLPLLLCRYGDSGVPLGVPGAKVRGPGRMSFRSRSDGYVYAAVPPGTVNLSFEEVSPPGAGPLKPQSNKIRFAIYKTPEIEVTAVSYLTDAEAAGSPLARISVEPTVDTVSGKEGLTGASARIEYSSRLSPRTVSPPVELMPGEKKIWFNNLLPGVYTVTVIPPATFNGWPIAQVKRSFRPERARSGKPLEYKAAFQFENVTVTGRIQAMDGRLVEQDVRLEIYGSENSKVLCVKGGTFEVQLDWGVPLRLRLAMNPDLSVDGIPLDPVSTEQSLSLTGPNIVTLPFKYGIEGQAVDETGKPVPWAVIDVFDDQQNPAGSVAADADGNFVAGTTAPGSYFVAAHMDGGGSVTRQLVPVNSIGNAGKVLVPTMRPLMATRAATSGGGGDGDGSGKGDGDDEIGDSQHRRATREAFTDLAAYPVLTEEVSTIGPPAPSPGAGGGGAGAGYGQTVEQVIRDVLGWRPGGDVAGFQAALTGAFQLREVEGHTEWSWQQRGYAVQADMGALTGAQASIYARAKSALDQILPLLASLTPLNPALYPPQDLEAIRTVITTELQELVTELALPGGPRIQRVDQLFHLLTGEREGATSLNPDVVQGNLGTLRDRFGLTVDEIDTVDEERIVTNFRIVVEQVLALQASWSKDRGLLSPLDPRASFGTVLIWLSRSLEAVCESVADLNFALDSVFVDAAQRQVIELKFSGEKTLLLSDLLDWVERASRDEGPRIIQDAGKDGVFAFAPVLRRLRDLVGATRHAARHDSGLPHGMRTPRVDRALQVLVAQLSEATELAGAVRRDAAPVIEKVVVRLPYTDTEVSLAELPEQPGPIVVTIHGANFRPNASAVLIAQDREDLRELHTWSIHVTPPNLITTTFRNPATVRDSAGATWLVAVTNEDGTHSNQFPIQIPIQR